MMHVGIPRVHQGMFSTLGGYHEYSRVYYEYIGGCSVHQGDIMMHAYQVFYGQKYYNLEDTETSL